MSQLTEVFAEYGADIAGVMERFLDDEELYQSCLEQFTQEQEFIDLKEQIETQSYPEAFESAHGLKGVSGNLGLTPLYQKICDLVEILRAKDYEKADKAEKELEEALAEFRETYERAIKI